MHVSGNNSRSNRSSKQFNFPWRLGRLSRHRLRAYRGSSFCGRIEARLIQIGPNFLGVNHLRPYPQWEAFRDIIFGNLDIYAEIAQPKNVVKAGLRYINKIEVPRIGPRR